MTSQENLDVEDPEFTIYIYINLVIVQVFLALSYLRQILIELSLERVSLLLQLFGLDFQLRRLLLLVLERVHELVPFVQHGDHELFEVGLIPELGGSLADGVLGDRRHHVAHHVPHDEALRGGSKWLKGHTHGKLNPTTAHPLSLSARHHDH